MQAEAPLFSKCGHVGPYSQLLPFRAGRGGGMKRMALERDRQGLSRGFLESKLSRMQGRSTLPASAQGVGVQGPGPASWPGLFLAQAAWQRQQCMRVCERVCVSGRVSGCVERGTVRPWSLLPPIYQILVHHSLVSLFLCSLSICLDSPIPKEYSFPTRSFINFPTWKNSVTSWDGRERASFLWLQLFGRMRSGCEGKGLAHTLSL